MLRVDSSARNEGNNLKMGDSKKSKIKREEIKALIDEIPDNLLEMTLSYIKYLASWQQRNGGRDLGDLFGSVTDDFMEEWEKENHVRCRRDDH
jgi:hypothetical protein